jgi:hypothetical protein
MSGKYLGFTILKKDNVIALRFDEDEYIEIICNATNLNMTPMHYCKMLMSPCGTCGSDKVIICFSDSVVNTGLSATKLKLNYALAFKLSIPEDSVIYAPQNNSNNVSKETNATLTFFLNDVKTASIVCKIKNGQVYSLTENI